MFEELLRGPLGPSGHATTALIPLARDDRNASGLDRVPVVILDAGAVETLDHLGGAGAGFDGLEDAEGNEGRPPSSFRRSMSTTRVTWARALERWKGSRRTSQMSFHRPTWRGGVVVCHVAPVLTSASSKEMSRMRALQSVIQRSQVRAT